MSTYAFVNATQTAVGTGGVTLYTNATTASVVIGLTITNVTTGPVLATVTAAGANWIKSEPIGPGATTSLTRGNKRILTGTQTITVTSDTASSLDCIADIMTVT